MRLTKVTLRHFKSIIECELDVEPRITVLVGANEAGKTTILRAIKHLDPGEKFDGNSKSHTEEGRFLAESPIMRYKFALDEQSRSKLHTLIKKELASNSKDAGDKGSRTDGARRKKIPAKKSSGVATSKKVLAATVLKPVENATELTIEIKCVEKILKSGLSYLKEYSLWVDGTELALPKGSLKSIASNLIRVILLSEIPPIPALIPIAEVIRDTSAIGKIVNCLLRVGGLSTREIKSLSDDAYKRTLLPKANRKLTRTFCRAWRQEMTQVTIISGDDEKNLTIDYMDKVRTHRSPDQRSQGNKWFFSFLTQLEYELQQKRRDQTIILIDEPGLYLHPRGQRDLQEQFRKIASCFQLIYSTHMPFLINYNFPELIRTIDKTDKGTQVNNKPYTDRFEGLRRNIGIVLCDSFIMGERHLIVEGITDCMLITTMSSLFAKVNTTLGLGLPIIDLNRVLVVPAGNPRYAVTLATFSIACGIPYIVLLDSDQGGHDQATHILNQEAVSETNIVWTRDFLLNDKEQSSIEDIVPLEQYLQSVNSVFQLSGSDAVREASILSQKPVVKVLESFFEKRNLKFDKQKVMRDLVNRLDIHHIFDENKNSLRNEFQVFVGLFNEIEDAFQRQPKL